MRQKQSKALKVNKMYEPNRLTQLHLEQVYEQIIPKQIFVLHPPSKTIKSTNTCDEHVIKEHLG